MASSEIEALTQALARLPGLGPRSARRAVLHLMKKRETTLMPLLRALTQVSENLSVCAICGNVDTIDPCTICADSRRDARLLCVVEEVSDLWALDRSRLFPGRFHVLGGRLSALEGVRPEDLGIDALVSRVAAGGIDEVVLAMNATLEGQTTAHYLAERLERFPIRLTQLAHGLPVGGAGAARAAPGGLAQPGSAHPAALAVSRSHQSNIRPTISSKTDVPQPALAYKLAAMNAPEIATHAAVQSAGGVVLQPHGSTVRVALVKRHDGGWVLPKGHVLDGESLIEAALREVEEETGIDREALVIGDYLGGFPFRDFPADPRPKINHFFVMVFARESDRPLHTDNAHREAAWHSLPLKVRLKYPYQHRLLLSAEDTYLRHAQKAGSQADKEADKAAQGKK